MFEEEDREDTTSERICVRVVGVRGEEARSRRRLVSVIVEDWIVANWRTVRRLEIRSRVRSVGLMLV